MEILNRRVNMSLFLSALFFLASSVLTADGYQFHVGGTSGWSLNPKESYSHWAGRLRFQVNDTLYFKYNKDTDSVLIVHKDQYDSCNVTKPIHKLDGGVSTFKFTHSGPFFFITSNVSNCQNGQKLIVVVLALRHHQTPHVQPPLTPQSPKTPGAAAPVPSSLPPAAAPWSYAPAPKKSSAAVVFDTATFLISAVCVLLGLSMISV